MIQAEDAKLVGNRITKVAIVAQIAIGTLIGQHLSVLVATGHIVEKVEIANR